MRRSELDHQSISGDLERHVGQVLEHAGPEMRQDDPPASKPISIPKQRREVDEAGVRCVERPDPTDEQVGTTRDLDERIAPPGITGVADRRPVSGEAQAGRRCRRVVGDVERRHLAASDRPPRRAPVERTSPRRCVRTSSRRAPVLARHAAG